MINAAFFPLKFYEKPWTGLHSNLPSTRQYLQRLGLTIKRQQWRSTANPKRWTIGRSLYFLPSTPIPPPSLRPVCFWVPLCIISVIASMLHSCQSILYTHTASLGCSDTGSSPSRSKSSSQKSNEALVTSSTFAETMWSFYYINFIWIALK